MHHLVRVDRDNLRQGYLHAHHKLRRPGFICLLLVFTILLGIIGIVTTGGSLIIVRQRTIRFVWLNWFTLPLTGFGLFLGGTPVVPRMF